MCHALLTLTVAYQGACLTPYLTGDDVTLELSPGSFEARRSLNIAGNNVQTDDWAGKQSYCSYTTAAYTGKPA